MRWNFLNQATLPIGVDIGSSGVKLMQLDGAGTALRAQAASRKVFGRPLPEEPVQRKLEIERTLRAAMEMAPFKGNACVIAPSPSDLMIRAVRLPSMTDEERNKAVRWEASERFGVPMDEIEVEWILAGEVSQGHDTRDEVILIASRRAVLDSYLEAVLAVGLRPLAVDASFLASARNLTRPLRRQEDQSVARMIIDVGLSLTTVSITRGRSLAFVKTIVIAGRNFNKAVSDRLSLDEDAASQLRIERMNAHAEDPDTGDRVSRAAFEAIRPHMHELAQEAALCLRYYSVTFRGARPDSVSLIGGEAREPKLASILNEHLKVDAVVANPLEGIDVAAADMRLDRRHASLTEWGVAAGLSMRQAATLQVSLASRARAAAMPRKSASSERKRGVA